MKASLAASGTATSGDDAKVVHQVFRDPAEVRWTWVRVVAAVLAAVVACFGVVFAAALWRGVASAEVADRIDLASLRERARASAFVAPLEGPLLASRPEGAPAWAPETGRIARRVGWVDAQDEQAAASLVRHADALTDVVMEGLSLEADGTVQSRIPRDMITVAHGHGLSVLAVVSDGSGGELSGAAVSAIASDPARSERFSQRVVQALDDLGADGVVLSLEEDPDGDADGAARESFLHTLRESLGPRLLALAVAADFEPTVLRHEAEAADLVLLRPHRDADDGMPAGPAAPHDWLNTALGAARATVSPEKVVPMLPTRSVAWTLTGEPASAPGAAHDVTWAEAMAKASLAEMAPSWVAEQRSLLLLLSASDGPQPTLGVAQTPLSSGAAWLAWLTDGATFADGLALARMKGLANVGIDDLGGEDPRVWRVLEAADSGPHAVGEALTAVPPYPVWQILGEGVEMRVHRRVQDGRADVSLAPDGTVSDERFEDLPKQVTTERKASGMIRTVALTFDDGPDPKFTPAVLDILARHKVKATFFLIGAQVERNPELVQRIVAEGHEVGNHSFTHPDLGKIPHRRADLEIRLTNLILASVTGRSTVLLRPPFRADDTPQSVQDLASIEAATRNGMHAITSTIDPRDWERPGADVIVDRVLSQVAADGAGVVLLHDGGGDRSQTVRALDRILSGLEVAGFATVQIHDLMGSPDVELTNPPIPSGLGLLMDRLMWWVWWSSTLLIRCLRAFALFALTLVSLRVSFLSVLSLRHVAMDRRRAQHGVQEDSQALAPAVSVVVPAFNEREVIERTVRSVLASRGVEVEVLVIDDGSTDGTADVVQQAFATDPRVQCLSLRNGGKARALNHGFRCASHEIVVAMDADSIYLPDTIGRLVALMTQNDVAAVAGRVVVGNARGFIGRCQALEYVDGQAIERRAWASLGVVSVVPGVVGAWRRGAVLAAGGFGRDTLAEDCDLTIALQVVGWRILYAPEAIALTEAPEALRPLLKQRVRWTFGVLQTLWKHHRGLLYRGRGHRTAGALLFATILSCHLGLPLFAPLADLAASIAIYLGYGRVLVPYVVAMFVAELLLTSIALAIDRASPRIAWDWPLQRAVYRWILFVALVRASLVAVRGTAVGWNKLARTGTVHTATEAAA